MRMVPVVPKRDWKNVQKMIRQGWGRLGFKAGDFFIFPSEKLIASFPDEVKTVEQKRAHIKVWIKEYCNLMKNPTTYHKLFDGSWNFDIFMDMIFSFWRLTPITKAHKQVEPLLDVGLAFKCNCPRFMHYHTCKHALALSLHFEKVAVPLKFSVETAGKRHATAGASLSRRAMCLVVDN